MQEIQKWFFTNEYLVPSSIQADDQLLIHGGTNCILSLNAELRHDLFSSHRSLNRLKDLVAEHLDQKELRYGTASLQVT